MACVCVLFYYYFNFCLKMNHCKVHLKASDETLHQFNSIQFNSIQFNVFISILQYKSFDKQEKYNSDVHAIKNRKRVANGTQRQHTKNKCKSIINLTKTRGKKKKRKGNTHAIQLLLRNN